mgnify:CR=1 FL=1|tara:strand:- start:356 stop:862 length:507 start_codon:yes stop_codon:yes gene_type:complete
MIPSQTSPHTTVNDDSIKNFMNNGNNAPMKRKVVVPKKMSATRKKFYDDFKKQLSFMKTNVAGVNMISNSRKTTTNGEYNGKPETKREHFCHISTHGNNVFKPISYNYQNSFMKPQRDKKRVKKYHRRNRSDIDAKKYFASKASEENQRSNKNLLRKAQQMNRFYTPR